MLRFIEMKNIIKCLFLSLFLIGCGSEPSEEKLRGIWKSKEGATIELKSNNFVEIANYPLSLSNSFYKGKLNGNGTWRVYKNDFYNRWMVELSVTNNKIIPELLSDGIIVEFVIDRSGFLGNGPEITSLFVWLDDSDLSKIYEFKKYKKLKAKQQ